jgi:hypothetical protein
MPAIRESVSFTGDYDCPGCFPQENLIAWGGVALILNNTSIMKRSLNKMRFHGRKRALLIDEFKLIF